MKIYKDILVLENEKLSNLTLLIKVPGYGGFTYDKSDFKKGLKHLRLGDFSFIYYPENFQVTRTCWLTSGNYIVKHIEGLGVVADPITKPFNNMEMAARSLDDMLAECLELLPYKSELLNIIKENGIYQPPK